GGDRRFGELEAAGQELDARRTRLLLGELAERKRLLCLWRSRRRGAGIAGGQQGEGQEDQVAGARHLSARTISADRGISCPSPGSRRRLAAPRPGALFGDPCPTCSPRPRASTIRSSTPTRT